MSELPVLQVRDLARHFGGVRALDGVCFRVAPGEVLGIIGPNGSGKTTLINCIAGFLKPTGGSILFRGREIGGMPPHRVADMGIARTFQIMRPFQNLTVQQNLVVPLYSPRARRGGGRHGDRDTVALDILEELGFERDSRVPHQLAGTLPTGYLKRLELGRCVAMRPELILCDEVFSGLSVTETASLVPLVRGLSEQGMTLIMIEHRLRELFELADRVLVLSQGKRIAEGDPERLMDDPAVREAYLGSEERPT